jgi:hypothetical protein
MINLKRIGLSPLPGPRVIAFNPDCLPNGGSASLALYTYYIAAKMEVADAIRKLVAGGAVQEYHVGSRGLKRYSLDELQNLLTFWSNLADDALNGGSSIKVRRAAPCDV